MYVAKPFQGDDETGWALIEEIPVGQLVTATVHGPLATAIPWVPDVKGGAIVGHMARPNPQWQTPWMGQALVLFEGPNGYVSPSWYATKGESGRVVPTWDYVVVQVYGALVIHDDESWVSDVVRRLTDRHEQIRTDPWTVDDAPPDYLSGQLRGIVGVEVRIERMETSVKMSQNKSPADVAGVVAGFVADGNEPAAGWVRRASR
ncbi:MAG: FMN-binding negative transcriptional regulator [Actinomycetales bacterium]|nr:FMN-binding negative transcriptional regulator [Actinomycetales bacterium]